MQQKFMFLYCVIKDFMKAGKGFLSSLKVKNGKMSPSCVKLLKGIAKIYESDWLERVQY